MAIALDNSVTNTGSGGITTLTQAFTTSGNNRYMFVGVVGTTAGNSSNITGVTYAGVSMTLVDSSNASGDRWNYLFYLKNPALGNNNVVVSASATDILALGITSYTGVAQVTPEVTVTRTMTSQASPFTPSITTLTNGAWVIGGIHINATPTAGTGTTQRTSNSLYDSNGPLSAGSNSLQVTYSGSISGDAILASIGPSFSGGLFFAQL